MTKRQPKGTPIGGQFAQDRKPSGGDLDVALASPRIIAKFRPQKWINDYAVDIEDGAYEFDVTDALAAMTTEKLLAIGDHSDEADALWQNHIVSSEYPHDGPFEVEVEESIRSFIGARSEGVDLEDIEVRVGPGGIREWYKDDESVPPPIGTKITVAEARALPSYVEVMAAFESTGDREFRLMARDLPLHSDDDEYATDARRSRRFTNLDTGFEVFLGGEDGQTSPTRIRVVSHG
jgi:hypothetical protein